MSFFKGVRGLLWTDLTPSISHTVLKSLTLITSSNFQAHAFVVPPQLSTHRGPIGPEHLADEVTFLSTLQREHVHDDKPNEQH